MPRKESTGPVPTEDARTPRPKLRWAQWRRAALPPLRHAAPGRLSLLHRFAVLYLTLPVCVWLLGWFEWWFGLPAALLLAAAVGPLLKGSWRLPRPRVRTVVVTALALAWTMLTAHGGVFDGNNTDWPDRRAILLDLSRYPWPTRLTDDLARHLPWGGGERSALLRYYLAWYMVPGLAGRVFGTAVLNWVVPAWTGLGVALVLLLFGRGLRRGQAVLAAAAFVLFSGMDPLRILLLQGPSYFALDFDVLGWPAIHPRNYSELDGLKDVWTLYLSNTQSLMLAPHLIPAALYALLLLHLRRHRRFVAGSGVLLAVAPFWSPFVAVGLVPLVAAVVWENGLRRRSALWSWSNLCLAAPLAGLCGLYLALGDVDFGHGWLWERYGWPKLRRWAHLFYLSECVPHLLLVLALRPRLARRPFFIASAAALLLLPWYRAGGHNLTMQGAYPALVLLCHYCVRAVLAGVSVPTSRHRLGQGARRLAFGTLLLALAVGAAGSLMLFSFSIRDDVAFQYARSGLTAFALSPRLRRENLAAEGSPLLDALLKDANDEAPKRPAEPLLRAGFDVYAPASSGAPNRLVLVNERCAHEDRVIRGTFVPTNPDTNAPLTRRVLPRWYGGGCGAVLALPGWPLASVRIGQLPAEGGDWAMEVMFDAAGRVAGVMPAPPCWRWPSCPSNPGVAALRDAHQRATDDRPVVKSVFDVYLTGRRLVYVRAPCRLADVEARFLLHLDPEDPGDLPVERAPHGFVNLDFAFAERGGMLGDVCVATVRLPEWPVREVRTGQFNPHRQVWLARLNPR